MTQLNNTEPTLRMNWPKTGRTVTGWAGGTLRKGNTVSASWRATSASATSASATIQDGGYFEINMGVDFNPNDLVQQPIIISAADGAGRTVSISTSTQRVYPSYGSPAPAA